MYCSPRRTTSDEFILVHEAKQLDRGETVGNPAIPVDETTRNEVLARLEREGLEPAWRDE